MRNDNEMHFIDESNEQTIQTSNNYSPVPSDVPNDGSTASKLANAKMVRIRVSTKCAPSDLTWKKPYYQINVISTIDNHNPKNENEVPVLEAEKTSSRFCSGPTEFTFYDAQSKQPYSTSRYNGDFIKHNRCICICLLYLEYPDIITNKVGKTIDISTTKCYCSRSFYRTFEYQGKAYYKLGQPYIERPPVQASASAPAEAEEEKECSCFCPCCCFRIKNKECDCMLPCCQCCCCKKQEAGQVGETGESGPVEIDKRVYVNIFNMSDQCVGKYVYYFDQKGCPCALCGFCQDITLFYEVYFPSDANELLKLSLISQLLFILDENAMFFGILPGDKENLSTWIS